MTPELGGDCGNNPQGVQRGTDPNRNYPGFWGGPGASTNYRSETYRGDEPSILPEVQHVRWVVSHRQVTGLITLHTFGNLILRPPGVMAVGAPPLYWTSAMDPPMSTETDCVSRGSGVPVIDASTLAGLVTPPPVQ